MYHVVVAHSDRNRVPTAAGGMLNARLSNFDAAVGPAVQNKISKYAPPAEHEHTIGRWSNDAVEQLGAAVRQRW